MKFYVYLYLDPNTYDIFYVGKGKDERWKPSQHIYINKWLNNKINKIGKENVLVKIIQCKNEQDAFDKEMLFIKKIGRRDQNKGSLLNLTDGGEGNAGAIQSEENRKKKSLAHKGIPKTKEQIVKMVAKRKANGSYVQTPEKKLKNSIANKGRISEKRGIKLSKEHREKIRKATTGKNNPMYGKKHSEATKRKMKAVWERRRNNG